MHRCRTVCSRLAVHPESPNGRLFFLLPFLVAAKQEHINGFTIRNEKGFRLILDKPMVLHADGEYCADVTRVEFRCLEKKLWLLHEQKGVISS